MSSAAREHAPSVAIRDIVAIDRPRSIPGRTRGRACAVLLAARGASTSVVPLFAAIALPAPMTFLLRVYASA